MGRYTLSILMICICFYVFGQHNEDAKYRFSRELFASDKYVKGRYELFTDKIAILDSNTYKFGEKTIEVFLEKKRYEVIFKKGIFNPDIVFGKETIKKDLEEMEPLTEAGRILYNLTRNDRLSICCVQELEKLNPNPQTKRFVFWLLRVGVANPLEYYFELSNEKATADSTIEEFLESAEMTFFYQGTLIL